MKRDKPSSSPSVCAAVSNIREQEGRILSVPEARQILKKHLMDIGNGSTKEASGRSDVPDEDTAEPAVKDASSA